jgi:hypothetical protein
VGFPGAGVRRFATATLFGLAIAWGLLALALAVAVRSQIEGGRVTVGAIVAPSLLAVCIACALNTGIARTTDPLRPSPARATRRPPSE